MQLRRQTGRCYHRAGTATTTMSIVPYRPLKRRPKRRPLDQAQVVQAALALLDDVGLEALTMRALSERLGVKAASLYRHVRHKDELLQLLADEINGEIPLTRSTGDWRTAIPEMARNVRKGTLPTRDAAALPAVTR